MKLAWQSTEGMQFPNTELYAAVQASWGAISTEILFSRNSASLNFYVYVIQWSIESKEKNIYITPYEIRGIWTYSRSAMYLYGSPCALRMRKISQ